METPTRPDEPAVEAKEAAALAVRLARRYRLEQFARAGAIGEVWDAVDELHGRPVAVEILARGLAAASFGGPRFSQRLREALRPWFEHPNAVSLLHYEADEHTAFLIMERVEGPTLQERFDQGDPIDPQEAA